MVLWTISLNLKIAICFKSDQVNLLNIQSNNSSPLLSALSQLLQACFLTLTDDITCDIQKNSLADNQSVEDSLHFPRCNSAFRIGNKIENLLSHGYEGSRTFCPRIWCIKPYKIKVWMLRIAYLIALTVVLHEHPTGSRW